MKGLKIKHGNIGRQVIRVLAIIGLFLLTVKIAFAAGTGTDYLASAKDDVTGTFGEDSSLIKWVYLAEGLWGTYRYIQTKNPALFAGVPLVMIFTHLVYKVAA